MAEEVKISVVKSFFTNPISWVLGLITLGTMLYTVGGSSQKKEDINTDLINTQVVMKADIGVIKDSITSMSGPIRKELQELKGSIQESKNAYNGLRTVVMDHTKKASGMTLEQFENYMKTAPELKKNNWDDYLFQIPSKDSLRFYPNLTLK
jgi:hypothetical protein